MNVKCKIIYRIFNIAYPIKEQKFKQIIIYLVLKVEITNYLKIFQINEGYIDRRQLKLFN